MWLYTLPTKTTTWNYLFNMTYGFIYLTGSVVSIFYGIHFGVKSNIGKMLIFLGLGLLTYEIGNIIWVYYNLIRKVAIPFPSLADVSYILFYPIAGIGCFYLLRLYKSSTTTKVYRDSLIIVVVAAVAVFGFFSKPDLSAHLPLAEKIINFLYPMGDVILLSMSLIAIRVGRGKIHSSLYIFCLGLLLFASADFIFIYRTANGTYWNGDIADLLYTCGGYVISAGLFTIVNNLITISTPSTQPVEKNTIQPIAASPSLPITEENDVIT